jgi:predicted SAM-dependent methyltransferase
MALSFGIHMELKYHFCCGEEKLPGFVNVDSIPFGQEIVFDLNKKWNFAKDNSADYILIKDGLEHLDSVEHFLSEASRVLKPQNGTLEIHVPHFKNPSAYRVTHKHYFSWSYWNVFPEPHDKTKDLKVIENRLVKYQKIPILGFYDHFINLFPKFYEKMSWVHGIKVKLAKTRK